MGMTAWQNFVRRELTEFPAEEAIRSLHAEFFSDPDPEIFDIEAVQNFSALKETLS